MLYVCPTPIGNLEDITLRALRVLREADLVVCEDTRRAGKLLKHFGIEKPLLSFFEHNELRRVDGIAAELEAGRNVALISDAGMPGLSDPGFTLIRELTERGLPLTVLPGPSAVDVAVVASALPAERFVFIGYLPRGSRAVEAIENADAAGAAVVAFESPKRLSATLAALAERWPERRMAVCRELSKLHEEILRGKTVELAARIGRVVRGEIALVLEPEEHRSLRAPSGGDVDGALRTLLERGLGTKEASRLVASLTGISARRLYERALELRPSSDPEVGGPEVGGPEDGGPEDGGPQAG
ncbi:MAG: 16S rRNA (cytidine(1402)-2'-O)-methyltransferase [Thermoleophilia bacterium]